MIRPRGSPPIPSDSFKAIEPVGITSVATTSRSPSRMAAPAPNSLLIFASVSASEPGLVSASVPGLAGVLAELLAIALPLRNLLNADESPGHVQRFRVFTSENLGEPRVLDH